MRAKYKFQVIQDTCLLIILLSLMGFHLWGEWIHEWLGVTFLAIVILHCGLNLHWFKKLRHGEYTRFRVLQVTLNSLLLLTLLTALISGVILSRLLFYDFPFHHPSDLVRKIHMTSVHWIQIIAAVHLGMHWKMLATFFCAIMNIDPRSMLAYWIMPLIFTLFACYGLSVFISQGLILYLGAQVDFSFFAWQGAATHFYIDYLAVAIFFAWTTRVALWLLFFRQHRGD